MTHFFALQNIFDKKIWKFLYKCRNGLLPMQYVFLIRSSAGCKKYVTRRSWVTYFLQPAQEHIILLLIYMWFLMIFYAKTIRLSFTVDVVRITTLSESVMGRVLKFSQTNGIDSI